MIANLSLTDARDLEYADLIERAEAVLAAYDKPDIESHSQKLARITRSLDELPALYRWFLQLQSWCEHWAQSFEREFGRKDTSYQKMRQRRDFFDRMASAAKMRSENASRIVTVETSYDPTGLPVRRS